MCENILTQQAGIPDHISGEKGCTLPVSENIPSGHAGNQGNLSGEQGCTLPVREHSEWACWKSRTPIWWARLYIACVSTFSHNNLEINTTHLVRKGVHCLCLCENMCQGYLSSTEQPIWQEIPCNNCENILSRNEEYAWITKLSIRCEHPLDGSYKHFTWHQQFWGRHHLFHIRVVLGIYPFTKSFLRGLNTQNWPQQD